MTLAQLTDGLAVRVVRGADRRIARLTLDSRTAGPDTLFAAVRDPFRDGTAYIDDALSRGAAGVLVESENGTDGARALAVARDVRDALGRMAHRLGGDPTSAMTLVGVTGTNGKTTFTYLFEAIAKKAGVAAGVVGTVNHRLGGEVWPADNTTPEAPRLVELLAAMRDAGATHVAMEVSSHGLALARVAGCRFVAGVFTNLSRDHMDFHATEEEYAAAKARLFADHLDTARGAFSVVNADDPWTARLVRSAAGRVVRYGIAADADYRIVNPDAHAGGVAFRLLTPQGALDVASPLLGDFQMYNLTAAAACAMELGFAPEAIVAALAGVEGVPGRMEAATDGEVIVLVDYAHTPGALENVAAAARRLTRGRLITVFGCGGDRDRGKRPMMARAAGVFSDVCVVTSDNPRTEVPRAIIDEILTGFDAGEIDRIEAASLPAYEGSRGVLVEEDRRVAIRQAIAGARPGDTVLIAGKGHEDYQIHGRTKTHLDDREEARAALAARRGEGAAS
ncbi:UDP-N-acetylmuramoyl-L-alanyl-D-glutamate--2,6-diaminopimelate ligase [bacterium]|nr:UDP-N-acetylmuramoyl-L-alanyl-D-glutamate--2,6-diaminopimelate ligase [bacterium]